MARQAESYIFMKRYDQAVEWGKKAINEDGSWPYNYIGLASALGHLGRLDEAREACASILAIKEDLSLAFYRRWIPIKSASDMENMLEGLRKAGLPEE